MSLSQRHSAANDDGEPDFENLVKEVVMYLISQEASKIPAKKLRVIKTVFQNERVKNLRQIMVQAKDALSLVFGYQLLESNGRYFLVNNFGPSKLSVEILREPREHRKRCSLLLVVLAVIFMGGGATREDVLFEFLKRLQIKVGDRPDSVFGDIKKFLTKECVQMLYLHYSKRVGTEPPLYEFSIGSRADAEIPRRRLLEFVCQVYGNSVYDWPMHLKELEQDEGPEGQRLSQLLNKRLRISQPSASQTTSAPTRRSSQKTSQHRSSSPQPGPSSQL